MRRFYIAVQVFVLVAALLVGGTVGYMMKPSSVVVVSAAQAVPADDACLFASGHKLGC
jgi:L-lactate permease